LASSSPRRKQVLTELGVKFRVIPSRLVEELPLFSRRKLEVSKIAQKLAVRKAEEVCGRVSQGLVIGADTIVALPRTEKGGEKFEIIGKPRTIEEAKEILRRLGGTSHQVYTGLAIIDAKTGKRAVGYEVSLVRMKRLSEPEISRISQLHLDKAGAYGIKERNDLIVDLVKGSLDNVMGMPRKLLKELLGKFGVRV